MKRSEGVEPRPDVAMGRRVWVSMERTFNLGNYENVKVSVGVARDLDDDEQPKEAIVAIKRMLAKQLVKPRLVNRSLGKVRVVKSKPGPPVNYDDDVPF